MTAPPKRRQSGWFTLLLVAAAIAVWAYEQKTSADRNSASRPGKSPPMESPRTPAGIPADNGITPRTPSTSSTPGRSTGSSSVEKSGGYESYQNCTLADARNNDGDSFRVALPDGRSADFRLYFVDTPESAFKTYPDGDTNHQRIAEQARYFGDITPEQAVEFGQKAKHYTLDLLASRPFTLYTVWDSPFRDDRFHAFIRVTKNGKSCWLDELLVEKGYVRIYTKGADLPDGTSYFDHKTRLKSLESSARNSRAGAWGL